MTNAGPILISILNSLWQAAIVAALVWLAMRFLPRLRVALNAATRHAIWWAVLMVVLILPVGRPLAAWVSSLELRVRPAKTQAVRGTAARAAVSPLSSEPPAIVVLNQDRASKWPLVVLGLWAAVFLYRSIQIARSYFYLRGVKARASIASQPLTPIDRPVRLLLSKDVASPMAVGFLRPAVILPESLPEQLDPAELDHVLLHEAAHLARKDDWTNLIVRVLGAALALHPVALWILHQIEREREIACDDWVVAHTGAARPYAASLARMFELRWARKEAHSGEALASGIFGGGSRLGERIELLLRSGREFSAGASMRGLLLSSFTLLALAIPASLSPRWIAFAQPAPRPEFEVASIKLRTDESNRFVFGPLPGGRLSVTNNELRNVIDNAYGIQAFQLVGGPDWINTDRYDIEAKAAGNPSWPEMKPMIRSLLEDRFKLKVHRETRDMPVYILGVAKGGLKLRLLTNENCVPPDRSNPNPPLANYCGNNLSRGFNWEANNIDMNAAAGLLTAVLRRQVIDRTGITGTFDVHTKWAADDAPDSPLPPLFTVLQDELGLKLESSKGPVEVLVIDHIERPDAN